MHMRAEHQFLNSRNAELDARGSRIETMYCTVSRDNSTAFGTPEAPQASQASKVQQAQTMQTPPSLILQVLVNNQDRGFRILDCQIPADPNLGSLTRSLELVLTLIVFSRPTYKADLQIARGNDPDSAPFESSSSDDDTERRKPISSHPARLDKKRKVTS